MSRLSKLVRKVVPREIRENPLLGIVAVAVVGPAALASLGASAASLIGASTIASSTAASIAVGTGIVSAGVSYLQTGDVSDSLRAGVLSGVGSYAGQVVSSNVTDAVSRATGAVPGQGISAGFGAGNQIVSTAGGQGFGATGGLGFTAGTSGAALGAGVAPTAAGVLAGNVLARSVEAAITGKPIEQAALFGAAQSIPFSLEQVGDFSSLDPIVKNVVASSAQAAVMGQDVGEAALAALIQSSAIVSRAISEIPGGQEFIKQKPIYAKYVIDSVSSALAAQLLDKDVSEAVVYSLARTTATVLNNEFTNRAKAAQVEQANQVYQEAEAKTARAREVADRLESINDDPKYARSINIINNNIDFIDNNLAVRYQESLRNYNAAYRMAQIAEENYRNATPEEQPQFEAEFRYQVDRANNTLRFLQEDQKAFDSAKNQLQGFKNDLTRAGYYNEVASLEDELNTLTADLTELTSNIEGTVNIIAQDASDLFRNFQVDVATTLAPLTGMDATDVTDADIVKEIQPPSQVATLDPNISAQAEDLAREEFAKVAQGEQVAALPAVAIPAAANVLTRTAIQAAPGVVRRITEFAANDPRFVQAVVENPYIQELLRAASLTAAIGQNGELLIQPIIQQNESSAETARLYRYATEVQSQVRNVPPTVVDALNREALRFEELAQREDIEGLLGGQPDMAVELQPEQIGAQEPVVEVDVTPQPLPPPVDTTILETLPPEQLPGLDLLNLAISQRPGDFVEPAPEEVPTVVPPPIIQPLPEVEPVAPVVPAVPREPEVLPSEEPARRPDIGPGTERPPAEQPLGEPLREPNIGVRPEDQTGLLPGARPEQRPDTRPVQELEPAIKPEEPVPPPPRITEDEIIELITRELEPVRPPTEEPEAPEEPVDESEEPPAPEDLTEETPEEPTQPPVLPPGVVTLPPPSQQFRFVPQTAPYRVTGMDESGILGRKGPIFGGDEDLQRADWNRRSLRLRRLLGL